MNCRKCGKEIQAGYQFCPFCGVIEPTKEEQLVLRNTDWLRFATIEDLESFSQKLKSMTTEELSMWRCGMHENIQVFQISVFYFWRNRERDGRHRKKFAGYSVGETAKKIDDIYSHLGYVDSIEPKKRNLSNSFKEEECGDSWFRTREECEEAISKIRIPRTESGEKNG